MPLALQPTNIIPINVTTNWANATNAAIDVTKALEESFPGVFQIPGTVSLDVMLVQVQNGYTAVGFLDLETDGTGTWDSGWGTYPAIGSVVYLIDWYA